MFKAREVTFQLPSVCIVFEKQGTEAAACEQSYINRTIRLSTSIVYNWYFIYFLTLSLTVGLIIYEIYRPKVIGDDPTDSKYLKVIYNFRDVAVHLEDTQRQSHFIHNFISTFALNVDELMKQPDDPRISSVSPYGSPKRMDRRSIYYCAHRMTLREHYLNDALSMTIWYSNELRTKARWSCGIAFLIAIGITIYLFMQGLWKMVITLFT